MCRVSDIISLLHEESVRLGIPTIGYDDAIVLYTLAFEYAASRGSNVLAIDAGAGIGYSTLWIARGLDDGCEATCRVIAVERDARRFHVGKMILEEHVRLRSVSIEFVNGDAVEFVRHMRSPVDMVFVDIDKHMYPAMLRALDGRLKANGLIVFHNAIAPMPPRELFEIAEKDPWKSIIVPTRLGLLVVIKKKSVLNRA